MSARTDEKIRCDACPVMCYIADGKSGACDRYANHEGQIFRLDPLTIKVTETEEALQGNASLPQKEESEIQKRRICKSR